MDNMAIYERAKSCPENALKRIEAGKLKGKSDINPMWRLKMLTELFGACGTGWKTENEQFWVTPGADGEQIAWCSINLVYRVDGEWSAPVFGIGGSMMVSANKNGLTSNDEAFKMAYTDAISVACKALGFAADVYWSADRTKYDAYTSVPEYKPQHICAGCGKQIAAVRHNGKAYSADDIASNAVKAYGRELCWECMKAAKANA